MSAAAQAAAYIKATYLARLSGAAVQALCTAAYSKAMHIAVLASATAQVQHPAAYSQAIYPAKLPGAAAPEQHTAAYISAWHISMIKIISHDGPTLLLHFATGRQISYAGGLGWRFAAALLPRLFGKNPRSHHKGATAPPQVGFELETNCFQIYAIANLDKTSLISYAFSTGTKACVTSADLFDSDKN